LIVRKPSVANSLDERVVLDGTPEERCARALALGDMGIRLYMQATGLSFVEARRRMRLARAAGRKRSVANEP
jgi:hypothetical protein